MKARILEADVSHRLEDKINNFLKKEKLDKNKVKFVLYQRISNQGKTASSKTYSVLILYDSR